LAGLSDPTNVTADVNFVYTPTNATSGTLTITIKNTSSIASSIRGFAFNLPGSPFSFTSIGGDTDPGGPTAISAANAGGVSGYFIDLDFDKIGADATGDYDVGVLNTNTGNFINGGAGGSNPQIAQGQSRTFTLAVVGSNLGSLTTANFLNTLSSGNAPNGNQFFVARFQAVDNQFGSDFAVPTDDVQQVIPEPSSIILMGLGVVGFLGCRARWRRRQSTAA
jgi:hypothetical protein